MPKTAAFGLAAIEISEAWKAAAGVLPPGSFAVSAAPNWSW
ncbi:hypothetical protein ACGFQG_31800 [Nocardia fluminea]